MRFRSEGRRPDYALSNTKFSINYALKQHNQVGVGSTSSATASTAFSTVEGLSADQADKAGDIRGSLQGRAIAAVELRDLVRREVAQRQPGPDVKG